MKIIWNKVTWYSKLIAVLVFVGVFFLGFKLGMVKEAVNAGLPWDDGFHMFGGWDGETMDDGTGAGTPAPVVGLGEHCGGNIKNAPTCKAPYICYLKVGMSDTGGVCAAH
jgi:hypothetical protein